MDARRLGNGWALRAVLGAGVASLLWPASAAEATSQWSRKTGMECIDCHTVFPRLNPTGEKFLRDGYVLYSAHEQESGEEEDVPILDGVSNLLGSGST